MDFLKNNAVAVIALVIAIIGLYLPVSSAVRSLGGTTNYDTIGVSGFQVGTGCNSSFGTCTGTAIARINTGQCYILPYATTIAASTTAQVDCQATAAIGQTNTTNAVALAGVTYLDNVVATLSTTTSASANGAGSMGLIITSASASTTNGYLTLRIANLSSSTFTWPQTGTASGTVSYIVTK